MSNSRTKNKYITKFVAKTAVHKPLRMGAYRIRKGLGPDPTNLLNAYVTLLPANFPFLEANDQPDKPAPVI